ncbi:AbrB family transcriptional regulator [Niallia endozanthoxylica]|uniref:AbrB family transcriptional regulator n=1 Tax=Niallia endozanthoxylica TaxID=2036016 RepID=A0A5J5I042_9BACI|nr:AbrB family transcriptional regulator [Niallia endozanthoxylica]KAA9028538.1 AbrB family transcriptional regulator [Niallia endozanthoxylica]
MNKHLGFLQNIWFVFLSGFGGFLLSLTGLPIGWMIGTLLTATFLTVLRPKKAYLSYHQGGMPKYWLYIGQCILGIELGQRVTSSVLYIFLENWLTILIMLLLSILFTLFSGFILWKYSNLDLLTSFFATAPGGLSSIPGIAEEVGANTGVVSIIQTMRVFLVLLTIPVAMSFFSGNLEGLEGLNPVPEEVIIVGIDQLTSTILFVLVACGGYYLGKYLRLPAPWLIGSMISVAIVKAFGSILLGFDLNAWWPQLFMIVSQIFIGASIGSRFQKNMFRGLNRIILISFLNTVGLIFFTLLCANFVSIFTDITFLTASLAFAPGGIAEMTTTALVLNEDSTFVVAVQVLRVVTVCSTLPPLFRLIKYMEVKKKAHSHQSA